MSQIKIWVYHCKLILELIDFAQMEIVLHGFLQVPSMMKACYGTYGKLGWRMNDSLVSLLTMS